MQSLANTNHFPTAAGVYFKTLEGRAVLALAGTGLMALCAHVSVPLLFTPVPLTLQTFAVLLIGFLLGPVMGFFSLLAYLMEGASGLPVFSPHGGPGGIAELMGPTGGYLLAYPFMAAVAGFVSRALPLRHVPFIAYTTAGVVASALLFAAGAGWLMALTHIGPGTAWTAAIAPFLPGEVIKICAAAGISRAVYRHPITES